MPKRLGKPITRPLEPNSFLPLQIIMRKFIILLLSCFHLASGNYDFFKHIYFFAGFGSELRIGTSNSMTSYANHIASPTDSSYSSDFSEALFPAFSGKIGYAFTKFIGVSFANDLFLNLKYHNSPYSFSFAIDTKLLPNLFAIANYHFGKLSYFFFSDATYALNSNGFGLSAYFLFFKNLGISIEAGMNFGVKESTRTFSISSLIPYPHTIDSYHTDLSGNDGYLKLSIAYLFWRL